MTIDEINTIRLALDTPEHNKHYVKHTTDAKKILNKEQEAINYTHCCKTLKGKEVIPFEDWRKDNCIHLEGDLYSFKHNVFDSYDLRYVYKRECKQSL